MPYLDVSGEALKGFTVSLLRFTQMCIAKPF